MARPGISRIFRFAAPVLLALAAIWLLGPEQALAAYEPTNLRLEPGNGQIVARWDAPTGTTVTYYRVRWEEKGTGSSESQLLSGTRNSWTITGLTNGKTYEVGVQTYYGNFQSSGYTTGEVALGVPLAPTNLSLTPDGGQITASWTAPSQLYGSAIEFYSVEYRESATSTWTTITPGHWDSGALSGSANTSHTQPIDFGAVDSSALGVTVSRVQTSVGAAGAIYQVGAALSKGLRIRMEGQGASTGTQPADDDVRLRKHNSAPATSYDDEGTAVAEDTDGGDFSFDDTLASVAANSYFWATGRRQASTGVQVITNRRLRLTNLDANANTSHIITGLTNGTSYVVRVKARTGYGESLYSATSTETAGGKPFTPAAPTLTTGNASLSATWTAPTDNGSPITDYDVQYRAKGGSTWSRADIEPNSNSGQLPGNDFSQGSAGDPIDLLEMTHANLTAAGLTIHREAISGGGTRWGVYRMEQPVHKMTFSIGSKFSSSNSISVRYSTTKPNRSNLHTLGTQLCGTSSLHWPTCEGTFNNTAANTYFWAMAGSGATARNRAWGIRDLEMPLAKTSATISGLTNGTEYDVQVRAQNAAGESAWSATSTLKAGLPAMPAAPSLTSSSTQLVVSWPAPSGNGAAITDYDVRYSSNNGSSWTDWNANATSTATTTTITGLTNGTTYQVQLRATNSVGDGEWSASAPGTPGAPATMAAPTLTSATEQLTAALAAPADNGSAILYYTVEYRQGTSDSWTRIPVGYWDSGSQGGNISTGEAQPADLGDLATTDDLGLTLTRATTTGRGQHGQGAVYEISEAVGSQGLRVQWDATFTWRPFEGLTVRTHSQKPTANNATTTGTQVAGAAGVSGQTSYSLDGTTGALGAGSYLWVMSKESSTYAADIMTGWRLRLTDVATFANATSTSRAIKGLTDYQTYQVRVRATNERGHGAWSSAATAAPGQLPGKPGSVVLTASSTEKASARPVSGLWNKAAPLNSANLYEVESRYRPIAGGNWTAWTLAATSTNSNRTFTLDLAYNREHQFRVRAKNTVGYGPYSNLDSIKVDVAPGKVAAPTLAATDKGLRVSWAAPANRGSAITDYQVEYKLSSEGDDKWATAFVYDGQTTVSVASFSSFSGYPVDLGTISDIAGVSFTNENTITPNPDEGLGVYKIGSELSALRLRLSANRTTPTNLLAQWSKDKPHSGGLASSQHNQIWVVHQASGAASADGVAENLPAGAYFWVTGLAGVVNLTNVTATLDVMKPSASTTRAIAGLTNDTAYDVRVTAKNAYGTGAASDAASGTPGLPPGTPDAPTLAPGNAQLAASWDAPSDTGSSAVNDYDVRYKQTTVTTWTELADITPNTTTSATITGLTNGTAYQVQVRAGNASGDGPWSATSTVTAGVPTTPAAPTLTSASGQISVSWPASSGNGSAITDYDVRYKATASSTWTAWKPNATSTAVTTTITGLNNGTAYQVQVRATNAVGDSAWSVSATGSAGAPATMAAPTLTSAAGQLTAALAAPADNGSEILYYTVEYRQGTSGTWSRLPVGYWDSGTHGGTIRTGAAIPADLGDLAATGLGLTLTRETTTATQHGQGAVYKITEAVGSQGLRVQWDATFTWTPLNGLTVRTHSQKPTANFTTTGTEVAGTSVGIVGGPKSYSLDGTTGALGAGSYLWAMSKETTWDDMTGWRLRLTDVATFANATSTSRAISGLTDYQAYQVRVRATNERGHGAWSAAATAAPGVAPGKPGAVALTASSTEKTNARPVSGLWNTADPLNSANLYEVESRHRPIAGGTWSSWTLAATSTNANRTFTLDLAYNREHQFRVRAKNVVGYGPYSDLDSIKVDVAPGKVAAPTLVGTDKGLRVSWAVPANRGSAITGYRVEYKLSSEGDDKWATAYDGQAVIATSSNFFTGTPLDLGEISDIAGVTLTREKSVNAISAESFGVYKIGSALSALRVRLEATRNAPTGLESQWSASKPETGGLESTEHNQIWAVPFGTGSASADGVAENLPANSYFWITGNAPNFYVNVNPVTVTLDVMKPSTTTARTVTGLTDNIAYDVRVTAKNAYGTGATSDAASGTPGLPPGAPDAPTLAPGNAQLSASWDAPSSAGSSAIIDYDVRYKSTADAAWTELADITPSTTTSATITGLTNGTAYQVQARAGNNSGDGPWSATSTATAGVPTTPAAPTLAPGNGSISVSWTAPADNGSAITGYEVRYRAAGTTTVLTATSTGTSVTLSAGITNGTEYEVQVRAKNTHGSGLWSPSGKVVAGAPAKMSAPTLANTAAGGQLKVSWSAPADNGSAITGYDLGYREASTTTWKTHPFTGTSTATTISGLANGKTHHVRVRAKNTHGGGPWAEASLEVGAPPAKLPTPTVQFGQAFSSNHTVDINWSQGTNNATSYEIWQRYRAPGGIWIGWFSLGSRAYTSLNTSVTYNRTHEFKVRASNEYGTGPFSDAVSIWVDIEPRQVSAPTVSARHQGLHVSWAAPASWGSAINDYRVKYQLASPSNSPWLIPFEQQKVVGPLSTASTVDGAGGVPLDLGAISGITGVAVTRESVGANAGVYKLGPALSALRLRLTGTLGAATNVSARWATTKPATGTLNTHGSQIAIVTSGTSLSLDGTAEYLPANSYFWITSAGSVSVTNATLTLDTLKPSAATSRTITGLVNDTNYNVRVAAKNDYGEGVASASATGAPAAIPDTPAAPTLATGDSSLAVSWTAPADSGYAITDYDVRYKATASSTWTEWNANATSTATTTTITGLTNGTTYQAQVRAANAKGEGLWSMSSAALKAGLPAKPGAPTLTARHQGLAVSWSAVSGNGSSVTAYDVQYSTDQTTWTTANVTVNVSARTATITGLANGTPYYVSLAARNTHGRGLYSDSASATPANTAPDAPATPTASVNSTNDGLSISWSAPGYTGGQSITDYDLRYSTDDGATWTPETATTDATTTRELAPLAGGLTYVVSVRAQNSIGESDWSAKSSIVSLPTREPDKPAAPKLGVGHQSLSVSWDAPADNGAAITDYDVQYSSNSGSNWTEWNATNTSTATTTTITGLTNGTPYQVQVRATNSSGDSGWSDSASAQPAAQPPDAPAAPTLVSGNAQLAASWSAPATNGSPIDDYDVQYSSDGGSNWTDWNASVTSTATTTTITGLTNGTTYQVRVLAGSAAGDGDWSPSATLKAGLPAKPGAPTLVVRHQGLAVSWTAPSGNGSTLSGFKVQYKRSSDSTWTQHVFASTGNTAGTSIKSLTNGTAYEVRVAAANTHGDGPYSDPASAMPANTAPDAPAAPTASVSGNDISVTWNAPGYTGGQTITDYDVQYSKDDGANWKEETATTDAGTTRTLSGLVGGESYVVSVRARNSIGESGWSAKSAAATLPTRKPDKPAAPTLAVGNRSIAVSWSEPEDHGAAITDYDVQYKAVASSTWTEWNASVTSTATSTTITALTNNTTYQVQVRATNSSGDSDWSDSASARPVAGAPSTPAAPTLVSGNAQLGASWSAPADNGSAITDYDVQYSDDGSTWIEFNANATSTATTTTITGLTNGTTYQVRVRATNSRGDSAWSPSATLKAGLPAKPGAPTLVVRHQGLAVSWTAPSDNGTTLSGFEVQYKKSADTTWTQHSFTSTGTTTDTTITGLTNNTAYDVRVAAANTHGDGPYSDAASATPAKTVPGVPAWVSLGAIGDALRVDWGRPTYTGGDGITDYDVRWSSDGGENWMTGTDTINSGVGRTLRDDLVGGETYVVSVRAENSIGPGPWSEKTNSATMPSREPDAPAAPTLASGNAQLTANWSEPEDHGAAITDYDVQYKVVASSTWTEWNAANTSTATTTTITGLTNGTEYQVQVRAANSHGESDWSDSASARPAAVAPSAPAAPTLVSGNRSIAASWSAPADNGAAITDYDVQYSDDGANWTVFAPNSTSTATTTTITGLTNGTTYQVQVRAANVAGEGPWSTSSLAIKAGLPAKPSAPTLASGNTSLTAIWPDTSGNGSAITDYDVQYSDDGGANWTEWNAGNTSTATTTTITGLTNGTTYHVQVRAANTHGDGPWSASAKQIAGLTPAAPAAPTLVSGNRSIAASWSAPADNGAAITDYEVQYSSDGGSTWTEWNAGNTSTATTTTITGLTNGTTYQVQVRAANVAGESPWSTSSLAVKAGLPAKPSAPTLASGNTSLTATWPDTSGNGSAITDYDAQYSDDGGANWTEWNAGNTSTATTTTITGLTNGTEYHVQVRAANTHGDGPWSASTRQIAGLTPAAPAAPTLVSGNRSIAASWSAPADNGAAITDYEVQYSSDGGSTWLEWNAGNTSTATTTTITGLTNGTEYRVQVRATNVVGNSPWSPSATLKAGLPAKPGTPALAVGNRQLTVSWPDTSGNGSAITDYDVRYKDTATSTWTDWNANVTSTATTTTITGLNNGTTYHVQVRATNAVGDSLWSDSAAAKPGAAPFRPSAPTLRALNSTVVATWIPPADNGLAITGYGVQYRNVGTSAWTDATHTGAGTTVTITGLVNNATYYVRVRAANAQGNGPWSYAAGATPYGGEPGNVTVTQGNQTLTLSWTAPANSGTVNGYLVRYRQAGAGSWTTPVDLAPSTTTHAFTNLNNAKTYETQVMASTTQHQASQWVSAGLVAPGGPSEPVDVWVHPANNAFNVSTEEPATPRGTVRDYDIRYRMVGAVNWTEWQPNSTGTPYWVTVTGLKNGTLYEVQMRAENDNGPSPWTAVITNDPGRPAWPFRPLLTVTNDGLRVRTINAPADHGSPITDYDVRFSIDQGKNWMEWEPNTTSATLDVTIKPFLHSVLYWVQYRAENAHGAGPWSDISTKRHYTDLETVSCDENTITTLGVGGYCEIMVGVGGVKPFDEVVYDNGGATSTLLYKIREGVHNVHGVYFAQFVAINPAGGTEVITTSLNGTRQQAFTVRVLPFEIKKITMTPESPAASSTFELLVELNSPMSEIPEKFWAKDPTVLFRSWVELDLPSGWSANSDPDLSGSGITKPVQMVPWYGNWVKFTVHTDGQTGNVAFSVTAKAPQPDPDCSANPMEKICFAPTPDTQQRTVNVSSPLSAMVTAQAGQTPAPPERVEVKLEAGQGQLVASWTPPASPSSPITRYEAQYRHHPNGAWTTWAQLGSDATSATITGLEPGGTYRVRVRAQNGFGWGGYTHPFAEITLPAPPPTQPPASVGAVSASRDGNAISVTWNAADGATGYNVVYSTDGKASWNRAATEQSETTYTLAGASDTLAYVFGVQAVNAAGTSDWTNSPTLPAVTQPPTKQPQPPASVGAVSVSRDGNAIDVSWNAANGATGYNVVYSTDGKASWNRAATEQSETSYRLSGANDTLSYVFGVQAVNAAGTSNWTNSATLPAVQQPTQPQPPGDVAGVIATHDGESVLAKWSAATGATGYDVVVSTDGGASWTRLATNQAGTSYTISNANKKLTYIVGVRAVNADGESAWRNSPPASYGGGGV